MPRDSTGRVLKADALRGLGSRVVFDFEDFKARCDEHARKARAEARRVVEEARHEADRIRAAAREDGRREGRAEGLREADELVAQRAGERARELSAAELNTLVPAVREAADMLGRERERWLAEWETRAVDLALAIAERIVHREFACRPERIRDVLVPVLELVAGTDRLELRLHPDDVDRLGPRTGELVAALAGCGSADVRGDETIRPGGCVVTTRHGRIDARIERQLQRIAEELHGDSPSKTNPEEDRS